MRIFLDDNTYVNFPDKGQKNWAAPLVNAFQAMANYMRGRLANTVQGSGDNTFTGQNTFTKVPTIRHISESNEKLNSGAFNVLRRRDISNIDEKVKQNSQNVTNAFSLLGSGSAASLLEGLQEQLLVNDSRPFTAGSAWNALRSFLPDGATLASVQEMLAALAKSNDALTPLGIIQPFWGLAPQALARWVPVTTLSDPDGVQLSNAFAQSTYVTGSQAGKYKLSGGMWAPCNGTFPLPPALLGETQLSKQEVQCWTPNLANTYLEGVNSSNAPNAVNAQTQTPAIIDKEKNNTLTLTTNELPEHRHTMEHDHGGETSEDGEHSHEYSYYGSWSSSKVSRSSYDTDKSSVSPGKNNTAVAGKHTHTITEHTEPTGNTGEGRAFDARTQRLPVAYYMRIR